MSAVSYTLATLEAACQTEMQDATGEHFTNAIVLPRINDTITAFLQATRIRRATALIDVVSGTSVYSLVSMAPRVLEVLRLALPSQAGGTDEIELQYLSQEEIEHRDRDWRNKVGWPYAYMRFDEGPQAVRLYPQPDSSQQAIVAAGCFASSPYGIVTNITGLGATAATSAYGATSNVLFKVGSLRVDYIASGTNLVSSGDSLETVGGVPPEFQQAIFNGTCARLCELDVDIAQAKKSQLYQAKYAEAVTRALSLANKGMQSKPARSVVVRSW